MTSPFPILAALALALVACGDEGRQPAQEPEPVTSTARLRAIHLAATPERLDLGAQGEPEALIAGLTRLDGSAFVAISTLVKTLELRAADQPEALSDVRLDLDPDTFHTLLTFDGADGPRGVTFTEDPLGPQIGRFRLRVSHAATGQGSVAVLDMSQQDVPPTLLYDELTFAQVGVPLDLPGGSCCIGFDLDQDGAPDLRFDLPAIPSGVRLNLYLVADGGALVLLSQQGDAPISRAEGVALEPPGPLAALRLMTLLPDAPAVDLHVNDARPIQGQVPLASSSFVDVGAQRPLALALTPAGAAPAQALAELEIDALEEGSAWTTFAFEAPDGPTLGLLAETEPPSRDLRLRVIHASPAPAALDVLVLTDPEAPEVLGQRLSPGEEGAPVSLAPGVHVIGVDEDGDGQPEARFTLPALVGRISANLFLLGDQLIIQQSDGATARIQPD